MLTTLATNVINFDVLDPDINFSDHLPLMCMVEISSDRHGRTLCPTYSSDEHMNIFSCAGTTQTQHHTIVIRVSNWSLYYLISMNYHADMIKMITKSTICHRPYL